MPINIPNTLNSLLVHPRDTLRRTPIVIAGGGVHGISTYSVITQPLGAQATRPGKYLGNLNTHAVAEEMMFQTGVFANVVQINCYTVAMFNWPGAPNTVQIPAPAGGNPKLVLTGQVTDCTFTVAPDPAVAGGVISPLL